MHEFKFKKVRDVKSPQKGNQTDAGIDFFIPNDYPWQTVVPGDSFLIPSGIIAEIPKGWMGVFLNKSGVASKHNFIVGAQVIDSGYSGEIHLGVHYVGRKYLTTMDSPLVPGQKLCQLVLLPVPDISIVETSDLNHVGNRKDGGFGSTGNV